MEKKNKALVENVIKEVLEETFFVPVGVSNRHVHLDRKACDALFGEGYELTPMRPLSQPGQFASEEKVDVISESGELKGVRILGPLRDATQIEISKTDARQLRKNPPIRQSGVLDGSTSITLRGPKGEYTVDQGLIVAARHIHTSESDAKKYGIVNGDVYAIEVGGERPMIMENVVMRVSDKFVSELHLDIDEANSADLMQGDYVKVLR